MIASEVISQMSPSSLFRESEGFHLELSPSGGLSPGLATSAASCWLCQALLCAFPHLIFKTTCVVVGAVTTSISQRQETRYKEAIPFPFRLSAPSCWGCLWVVFTSRANSFLKVVRPGPLAGRQKQKREPFGKCFCLFVCLFAQY